MNRRGFLSGILACGVAPAFVGATNSTIWVPQSAIATRPADILTGPFDGTMYPWKNYTMSFYKKAQDGQWERGIFHCKSMKPPSQLTSADFNIPAIYGQLYNAQLEEF